MIHPLTIGVVGPCGTGKSVLVERLKVHGFKAVHIAQEHSFAPKMWQVLTKPDILVYLQVSYPVTLKRKSFNWTEKEFKEQIQRLKHARDHADLVINTDSLTPNQIFNIVIDTVKGLPEQVPHPGKPTRPRKT